MPERVGNGEYTEADRRTIAFERVRVDLFVGDRGDLDGGGVFCEPGLRLKAPQAG